MVATLVHHIQATKATNNAGALLLFDISGFFDNINPKRAVQKFASLGFLPTMCEWTRSFLTNRIAELKVGNYVSAPFQILNGTLQGSLLLPILSAINTVSLLEQVEC